MDTAVEVRDSVKDNSLIKEISGGTLIEEAFDEFAQGIGKYFGKRTRETRPLTDEIISQYTKLQAPEGKIKFGDNEVIIFDKNTAVEGLERKKIHTNNFPSRPILKIGLQADWDRNQTPCTQEKVLEVFRRCYTLCNIPVSLLDENDPCDSLEILCEGIQKAFKAKDFCYKHVKDEENKRHSENWKIQRYHPQISMRINRFQEQIREYKDKIGNLTDQAANVNDQNSKLHGENFELQASKNELDKKLQNTLDRLEQLENVQIQNAELSEQNIKLKNQCDELAKRYELLEAQDADICQLNEELGLSVQKWTSHHMELKTCNDNLEITNKNLNNEVFKMESENSKLTNDLKDLKNAFKKNLEEMVDENLGLRGEIKTWQKDFKQLQGKYNAMDFEQKEIIEKREKLANDSRRYFEKTLKLQFQLDEHKKFKEHATKFNVEKNECQRKLKKLEYDYCTLQKSSHQLFLQNRNLLEHQKAAAKIVEDMRSKIADLEDDRETNAFRIDSLTRQILKQTEELREVKKNNEKVDEKRDPLRSLVHTKKSTNDPVNFNRNLC